MDCSQYVQLTSTERINLDYDSEIDIINLFGFLSLVHDEKEQLSINQINTEGPLKNI